MLNVTFQVKIATEESAGANIIAKNAFPSSKRIPNWSCCWSFAVSAGVRRGSQTERSANKTGFRKILYHLDHKDKHTIRNAQEKYEADGSSSMPD